MLREIHSCRILLLTKMESQPHSQSNSIMQPETGGVGVGVVDCGFSDDGSYFDLDISLPVATTDTDTAEGEDEEVDLGLHGGEFEFDFTISSADLPAIDPAHNVFFQRFDRDIPSSGEVGWDQQDAKDIDLITTTNNNAKAQFPALFKTAAKLKILFRRNTKLNNVLESGAGGSLGESPPQTHKHIIINNKFFTVKFKVVDVPLKSFFFSRDASKRSEEETSSDETQSRRRTNLELERDSKRAKEIVHKYMRRIKPLYVKISQPSLKGEPKKPVIEEDKGNTTTMGFPFAGNLKTAYKNLSKAKTMKMANKVEPKTHPKPAGTVSYRNESTLTELHNAVQGAIAHCKQSNNAVHDHDGEAETG